MNPVVDKIILFSTALICVAFLYIFIKSLSRSFVVWRKNRRGRGEEIPQQANTGKVFDYKRYATDPTLYQTWVDEIYNFFSRGGAGFIVATILMPVPVFLVGYYLARVIGFEAQYISSIPIYLGVLGIMLVSGTIRLSSLHFHKAYENFRPCILVSDEQYKAHIDKWFKRFSNNKKQLTSVSIQLMVVLIILYIKFFMPELFSGFNQDIFHPKLFADGGWFDPQGKGGKLIIMFIYAIHAGALLSLASRGLRSNFFFLLSFRSMPVIPIPNILKSRLEYVTNMYVAITIAWFVGVSLIGVLLFNDLGPLSLSVLITLSALGLFTFLTPQFVYRDLLMRSSRLSNVWVTAALYEKFDIKIIEEGSKLLENEVMPNNLGTKLASMEKLGDYISASSRISYWIYDPGDLLYFSLAQAITVGSFFVPGL